MECFSGNQYNNSQLVDVYANFVEEEMSEMFDEIDEGNEIGFLGELADSLVVGSFLYAVVNSEDFSVYDREPESIEDFEQTIVKLKKYLTRKSILKTLTQYFTCLKTFPILQIWM